MSDRTNGAVATTERKRASLVAVGSSGLVHYQGVLQRADFDRAWSEHNRPQTILHMISSPEVGAVLHALKLDIRSVPFDLEPPDDSPAARDVLEFVQSCFDDLDGHWPGDTLASMLSYVGWGWSCHEIIYKVRRGPNQTDRRYRSRFDDGKIGWRKWLPLPQETREAWVFDPITDDAIALIQRDPRTQEAKMPSLDKCIHLRYSAERDDPEGWTPLRSVFNAWYNKTQIQRIESISLERNGMGVPLMRVPARDIEEVTTTYTTAKNIVTNYRVDEQSGLVLASDRDDDGEFLQVFEIVAPPGESLPDFETAINRYSNEIARLFRANVMLTGQSSVGSFALASQQENFWEIGLRAHAELIANAITEQAIWPLCAVNGLPIALAPELMPRQESRVDLGELGQYVTDLNAARLLVDTPELRAYLHKVGGLPLTRELTQAEIDGQRLALPAETVAA